jgi:hypothetical protein
MPNFNPSPATRWPKGVSGNQRAWRSKWLRGMLDQKFDSLPFAKRLNLCLRYGDGPLRTAMAARLLEIAFTDQVIVIGRDENSTPIERVSSRESVDAIKTLWSYDMGKPSASPTEVALKFAEHLRSTARDHVEIGRQLIGKQAETWSPEQIRAFWDVCERDPSRFLRMAEDAIGVAEPVPVDVEPSQAAIAAPGEDGSAEQGLSSTVDSQDAWKRDEDQSSPKGCDMASHDPPSLTNRLAVDGAAPTTLDEDDGE